MIIHLNGPFGAGKTTTARLLVQRLPDAAIYDPEQAGFVMRRTLKPLLRFNDYQDLRLWRRSVVWGTWLTRRRARHVIVPQTLWRPAYYAEITAGLHRVDRDLHCFRLTVSEEALRHRIATSADTAARTWRERQIANGLAAMANPALGVALPTDGKSPDAMASQLCLKLARSLLLL